MQEGMEERAQSWESKTVRGVDVCCVFCVRDCAEYFLILTSPKNSCIRSCLSPSSSNSHIEEETEG